jgi:hypothetical protein
MSDTPFKRQSPSFAMQLFSGVMTRLVFAPLMWAMQKLGRAEKMFATMTEKREEQFAKKNPFRGYTPGPQDVFVMTFAKSGTNWIMQIVYQLIYHGRAEFDHIHDVVPWPDAKLMSPMMSKYAIPLEQADGWQTAPEHKRVIKTHFKWELIPFSEQARYIAVIRDPKDVFVSAYFFIRDAGMGGAMPPVETMHRLFLADRFMLNASWPATAAGYWAQHNRPNVLVLSYKSMKRDLEGTVRHVAAFLDIHVSDEVIQEVCRKASFDYMKSIDEKFAPGKMTIGSNPAPMLRKGRQGASGELLTPAQQQAIDEHCIAELKRLGSDLPYEEFADLAAPAAKTHAGTAAGR